MKDIWKLIVSFVLTFSTAFAGSTITMPAIATWYETIDKPFFTPPNAVFGPVWTALYFLMAVSLYLVWKTNIDKKKRKQALTAFFSQLGVNFLWSVAFFGLQQPLLGLLVILVLWGLIYQTIIYFRPISKTAAYLLYPYLAWVSFATLLNFAITVLNI